EATAGEAGLRAPVGRPEEADPGDYPPPTAPYRRAPRPGPTGRASRWRRGRRPAARSGGPPGRPEKTRLQNRRIDDMVVTAGDAGGYVDPRPGPLGRRR